MTSAVNYVFSNFSTRMLSLAKPKMLQNIVARSLCTTSHRHANHYDVLGVTPKATQSDIKSAYYKLSKMYHPDRAPDEESAKKFRNIAAAYEVLGNLKLKKLYDKGLLTQTGTSSKSGWHTEPEPTDPTLRFYKSHAQRHVTPTMDGRTPIYDFDAWSKNHYGNTFQKAQKEKIKIKQMREKKMSKIEGEKQELLIYLIFGIGGLFAFCVINGTTDYDNNNLSTNENKNNLKEIKTE